MSVLLVNIRVAFEFITYSTHCCILLYVYYSMYITLCILLYVYYSMYITLCILLYVYSKVCCFNLCMVIYISLSVVNAMSW